MSTRATPCLSLRIGASLAERGAGLCSVHDATQLKYIGFAHEVVAHDSLLDAAYGEARRYLPQSPLALSMMKKQVYLGMERSVEEHMKMHQEFMQVCFASEDHQEGVASFIERRPAVFTGAVPEMAKDLSIAALLGAGDK